MGLVRRKQFIETSSEDAWKKYEDLKKFPERFRPEAPVAMTVRGNRKVYVIWCTIFPVK